ncbi:hypothetical protein BDR06DRAFT_983134 [Suillus hirtellus]|nr:hypothetical protein BDR06DRAFT_983134 [Suillus hirtellus]
MYDVLLFKRLKMKKPQDSQRMRSAASLGMDSFETTISNFLDPGTSPAPYIMKSSDNWTPFCNQLEFEATEFLYTENQMSAHQMDKIIFYWGIMLAVHHDNPPFTVHKDFVISYLYNTINVTLLGDVAWQSFALKFNCPLWMQQSYNVWFWDPHAIVQNILTTSDYAWHQSDKITQDPQTHGAAFILIILGSNKTTVSVTTGQNNFYLLYLSIGNVHNNVWHAHHNALVLVGSMEIPRTNKKGVNDPAFCKFKKQMFHSSLSKILANLKPKMTTPEVMQYGDSHYHHVIYGLGPYITDYEEQVVLAGIVKNWCRRCLTFPMCLDDGGVLWSCKHTDALVDLISLGILWDEYGIIGELVVGKYLKHEYGKTGVVEIMDDIDQRIAVTPLFPGLWCFPQGHKFSQWIGDHSKALIKVYLPAIEGHIPDDLRDALKCFHRYHTRFQTIGVHFDISLLQQHSLVHYKILIQMFGAPNGLCSSITKSKHIKAALGQMLLTNQCLNKIEAARVDIHLHGMLKECKCAHTIPELADELDLPSLPCLICLFLYDQIHANDNHSSANVPLHDCPSFTGHIKIFHSTSTKFIAPSNPSRITGMQCEHIHAVPSWYNGPGQYNCAFVNVDDKQDGMLSMGVEQDELTGMWMVVLSLNEDGSHDLLIIHIDSIIHGAHLLPIFGTQFIPPGLQFHDSLDAY